MATSTQEKTLGAAVWSLGWKKMAEVVSLIN